MHYTFIHKKNAGRGKDSHPLHLYVLYIIHLFTIFTQKKMQVEAKTVNQDTPLHLAAEAGDILPPLPSKKKKRHDTPLHLAAEASAPPQKKK